MLRKIFEMTLKDKVESTMMALTVGVDDLEEHFEAEKIEVVQTYCKKR